MSSLPGVSVCVCRGGGDKIRKREKKKREACRNILLGDKNNGKN